MSQASTVAWLAVRELWMTFRLLLVLFAWIAAGAIVGIVSAPPPVALGRLAVGVGVATILGAVVAAWTLADERRAGRAGWLVTRSVARGTYLVGWFAALAAAKVAGLAVAGLLGWLAVGGLPGAVQPAEFSAAILAIGATAAAAVALGLLLGALFGRRLAAALALFVCGAAAVAAWTVEVGVPWLPGSAEILLARAAGLESILPDALRAAGIGLGLAAVLLVVARVALERIEL